MVQNVGVAAGVAYVDIDKAVVVVVAHPSLLGDICERYVIVV